MSYRRGWSPSLACGLLGLAAGILLAACDATLPFIGSPSAESIALEAGDVPKDLVRCPSSGDIHSYLNDLKSKNPDAYNGTLDLWKSMQAQGANGAAIVSFTADPAACTGEMGTGRGRTAANFVIQYKSAAAATEGWRHGLLGFPTPGQNQQMPGLRVGAATGLGANSWSLEQALAGRSLRLAFWQSHSFDVFYVGQDLSAEESQHALSSINGRIH